MGRAGSSLVAGSAITILSDMSTSGEKLSESTAVV